MSTTGPAPLKILHIYSSPNEGGATISIAALCSAFADRGHHVAVACRPGAHLLRRLDHRIATCTLPLRGALDCVSLWKLFRFIGAHRFDWINAHNGRDYPVAYLVGRSRGAHCALWRRYYRLNRSAFTRAVLRHADLVIALNEAQRLTMQTTVRVDPERLACIPNWIEAPHADSSAPGSPLLPGGCERPYRVAVFGNIHPHKGQKEFVEAAIQVLAKRSDVCFLIVGANEETRRSAYFAALHDMIEAAGRTSEIRFVDWVPDINPVLEQLTLTVVPSHGEAFGRVAAESMAAGVAVIGAEVAGLREIIHHGHNGILFPKGDSTALAGALTALLDNARLRERLAAAGRETVRREFSCDSVVNRIEGTYRRIQALSVSR